MPRKILQNVAAGAAAGSAGGPVGAAIGAGAGIVNSFIENGAQNAADRRSRKFQEKQAQKQFERQKYFDEKEKRWNSEQAQIQRMRDAGLNPNLVYGQLSASTVSTPNVPLPSTPNGVTRDFSIDSSALQGAQTDLDGFLKAAQVDNLNQNTASQFQDTVGKDIENRYKEAGIIQTLTEQLERINKIIADTAKAGADTATLNALRDGLVEQLTSEIALNKQKVEESKQSVSESESRVDVNRQNISESKSRVDVNKQNIAESKSRILTQESERDLNRAIEQLRKVETKDLLLRYHLDNDQYQMINKYVHDHDLPVGSEKAIIQALDEFAKSAGKTVPEITGQILESWLDGRNWLDFISANKRTGAIEKAGTNQTEDGTFSPRRNQPRDTSVLNRNAPSFEKEFDQGYSPQEKSFIMNAREKYPYLNESSRKQLDDWISKHPYSNQLQRAQQVQHLYYKQTGRHTLPNQNYDSLNHR